MSAHRDDSPTDSASPSRREVLLSAAGALALGLGAPITALAATRGHRGQSDLRLTFYRGRDEKPFHAVDLPEEAARVLLDENARVFAKVTIYSGDRRDPREADREGKLAEEIKVTYALDRVE